jgi:hypothetical protein
MHKRFLILVVTVFAHPLRAGEIPDLFSFVIGDYAVIGQYPDSSSTYSGSAKIVAAKNGLMLTQKIGSKTIRAAGTIEVPQPPGEGQVLRFRWQDQGAIIMTCLVAGDLDNYARLTCYWGHEKNRATRPGLEALFPTAVWLK